MSGLFTDYYCYNYHLYMAVNNSIHNVVKILYTSKLKKILHSAVLDMFVFDFLKIL